MMMEPQAKAYEPHQKDNGDHFKIKFVIIRYMHISKPACIKKRLF